MKYEITFKIIQNNGIFNLEPEITHKVTVESRINKFDLAEDVKKILVKNIK